jgi:hypothetical protein
MKKKKIFYMLLPVLAISGMCVFSACDAKQTPETVNGASDKGCDNILISVPIWRDKWVNEKHFNLLLDAEVDLVVAVTGVENETFDTSRHMLAMASKTKRSDGRMIKVLVHSRAMTDEILDYTEEEIQEMLSEFKGHEALGGYHIVDEPYNVQPFTRVEKIIKNYDPERIADINFLPGMAYGSYKNFYGVVDDYLKVMGDDASYLSFDNYPFPQGEGAVNESDLFGNFEAIRKAGLENDVPTAFYLQAVGGFNNSYRKPDEGTLRYHTSAALAYGFKWLKYWSWFVPDYGTDPAVTYNDYSDAIIGKDGEPTEMYAVASKLHKEIHNVGTILAKSDASLVYHTGAKSKCVEYEKIPSQFFIRPDADEYAILSVFTHKTTGEQYLMIVNKDMTAKQNMKFHLENIDSLAEIDKTKPGGVLRDDGVQKGTLCISLDPGDFAFYKINGTVSITEEEQEEKGENLLSTAKIKASASESGNGWFIHNAFDGRNYSMAASKGWKISSEGEQWLEFDLGEIHKFNRLNIYPAGTAENCGAGFPTKFGIYVSEDGIKWTLLQENDHIPKPEYTVPSFLLEETQSRFVRIVLEGNFDGFELAELKLFYDEGAYETEKTLYQAPVVTEGENIAIGKTPFASGSAYESNIDKWGLAYINDGSKMGMESDKKETNGWMSNAVTNIKDPTFVGINLGNVYKINRVDVYPRKSGEYFPVDFDVQISLDGRNWKTVAERRNESETPKGRMIEFAPVEARYVRILSVKLCGKYVDFAQGYLMQLSEIEIFAVK